jgi:hypothetical protein
VESRQAIYTGAAEWSEDTYIVADPEMYVEGVNSTGGLLLLKLDGSREARWPFGYRIQPVGLTVLRGTGGTLGFCASGVDRQAEGLRW